MILFKQSIRGFFLICLFALIQVAYADDVPCPPGGTVGDPNSAPVGKVVWVKGTFKATRNETNTRDLKPTSVIFIKDTLITDEKSQAQIIFTDQTQMTFREDSTFFIDQYSYHPEVKKGSVGKYFMNLIKGGFRTITGIIAKQNPDDYAVNTPVATIGVRGTDYSVYFRSGQMFIGYEKGQPCVTNKGSGAKGSRVATLCLDAQTPYAEVPGPGSVPVPLNIRPDALGPTLEIIPSKISQFGVPRLPTGGVINSFCITN